MVRAVNTTTSPELVVPILEAQKLLNKTLSSLEQSRKAVAEKAREDTSRLMAFTGSIEPLLSSTDDQDVPGNVASALVRSVHRVHRRFADLKLPVPESTVSPKSPFIPEEAIRRFSEIRAGLLDSLDLAFKVDKRLGIHVEALARDLQRACSALSGDADVTLDIQHPVLPETIYTLHPGTIWAIMTTAGLTCDAASPSQRAAAFICRKFYQVMTGARRDGITTHFRDTEFTSYFGKLFARGNNDECQVGTLGPRFIVAWTRVRLPRVDDLQSDGRTVLAATQQGLFAWGNSLWGQTGIPGSANAVVSAPTAVSFKACPKIQRTLARTSRFRRGRRFRFILTAWGHSFVQCENYLAVAGDNSHGQLGVGATSTAVSEFTRLRLSYPIQRLSGVTVGQASVGLHFGAHCLVAGDNSTGQLGLGNKKSVSVFTEVKAAVTELIWARDSTLFCSNDSVLLTGRSGVFGPFMPMQLTEYLNPTEISFPWRVKSFSSNGTSHFAENSAGKWFGLGDNRFGALGIHSNEAEETDEAVIRHWTPLALGSIRRICGCPGSFRFHTKCGVFSSGDNRYGRLGVEADAVNVHTPLPVEKSAQPMKRLPLWRFGVGSASEQGGIGR
ncbi:hypothetical protein J8273_4771 [Carpediemonas membranifera]|uniref:Uncharacterized protein n=1 Tax=Carpediemonas membranifera TaxID=201153 RepID=A0A8J6E3V0_9EUKA|nr:hypothetical protein J8273_4771 [Carpediemonas membranifera]|eukprot:KAG9393652.1 hypothetical protein J8273_4771 [Carpediemonas membranifera]